MLLAQSLVRLMHLTQRELQGPTINLGAKRNECMVPERTKACYELAQLTLMFSLLTPDLQSHLTVGSKAVMAHRGGKR